MSLSKRHFLGIVLSTSISSVFAETRPLDFGLVPEQAAKLAETAVSVIEKIDGQRLDYSPDSLKVVDRLVVKFRSEGNTPQTMTKAMIVFGCYVGEVFVRNLPYRWDKPTDKEYDLGFTSIGIRAQNGGFTNPIGKTFKLLQNGQEDSVAFLYEVAAARFGVPSSTAEPKK